MRPVPRSVVTPVGAGQCSWRFEVTGRRLDLLRPGVTGRGAGRLERCVVVGGAATGWKVVVYGGAKMRVCVGREE